MDVPPSTLSVQSIATGCVSDIVDISFLTLSLCSLWRRRIVRFCRYSALDFFGVRSLAISCVTDSVDILRSTPTLCGPQGTSVGILLAIIFLCAAEPSLFSLFSVLVLRGQSVEHAEFLNLGMTRSQRMQFDLSILSSLSVL